MSVRPGVNPPYQVKVRVAAIRTDGTEQIMGEAPVLIGIYGLSMLKLEIAPANGRCSTD